MNDVEDFLCFLCGRAEDDRPRHVRLVSVNAGPAVDQHYLVLLERPGLRQSMRVRGRLAEEHQREPTRVAPLREAVQHISRELGLSHSRSQRLECVAIDVEQVLGRETVDGGTFYQLLAASESWPETRWLTPWKAPDKAD